MTKITKTEREEQIASLRKLFPKGATVYTILDHVSRSGMSRNIRVVALKVQKGKAVDLHPNYAVQTVLDYPRARRGDGFAVGGCGMDMGFHVVSRLAAVLHGDERALKHRWL